MPDSEAEKPRYTIADPSLLTKGDVVFVAPSVCADTRTWQLAPKAGLAGTVESLPGPYLHISPSEGSDGTTRLIPLGREVSFGPHNRTVARWIIFTCHLDTSKDPTA